MPTGAISSGATPNKEPQKMRFNVQQVSNGFIVTLGYKIGWGEDTHIASTVDEVVSIISDYLNKE